MYIPPKTPCGLKNSFRNARLDCVDYTIIAPHGEVEVWDDLIQKLHHHSILGFVPGPFSLIYNENGVVDIHWGELPVIRDGIPAGYVAGHLVMDFGPMTGTGIFTNKSHNRSIIVTRDGSVWDGDTPNWERDGFIIERPTSLPIVDRSQAIIYGDFTILGKSFPQEEDNPFHLRQSTVMMADDIWYFGGNTYRIVDGKFSPTKTDPKSRGRQCCYISVNTRDGEKIISVV